MLPLTRLLNVPSGVSPNPNAVSRASMSGLVGIVFLTLLTVITNELPVQLLTVNLAWDRRVAPPPTLPDHVTVNVVFPFTNSVACAELGTAEARMSENTATGISNIFVNSRMRLLTSVPQDDH